MTIPRELRLDDEGRLIQQPVSELRSMRTNEQEHVFHVKRSVHSIPVEDLTSAEVFIDQIETQKDLNAVSVLLLVSFMIKMKAN